MRGHLFNRSHWFTFGLRRGKPARPPGRGRGRPERPALAVETLEDRALPSFLAPVNYDAGSGVTAVAAGDFNGDGIPDLAALNSLPAQGAPSLAALLGNGDGTFQPAVFTGGVGRSFSTLAVTSFTGNGLSDVLVRAPDGNLAVMLSNGNGSFQPPQEVPGTTARLFAVGDLNGDGLADLVVATNQTVQVYLGQGDGTFQAGVMTSLPANATGVTIADFTGDGQPDVLVTHTSIRPFQPAGINLLVGNGDGTFQDTRTTSDGTLDLGVQALTVADFNGDGALDIFYLENTFTNVLVRLNNGDGTFETPLVYFTGPIRSTVAVQDVNGDGYPDVLCTSVSNGQVKELLGNGDGTFQAGPDPYAGADLIALGVLGDFNGDGIQDLAAVAAGGSVAIRLGNPDGTFAAIPPHPAGSRPWGAVVGDFNNDGLADLALANNDSPGSVSLFLGNGDGTFQPPRTLATGDDPASLVVGDFNQDGNLDLTVLTDAGVKILLGAGDGTFQTGPTYTAGLNPTAMTAGDVNGDGYLDLVVANYGDFPDFAGSVSIFLGNGDGSFRAARDIPMAGGPSAVAVGDFNGDHRADIAVSNHESGTVSVLLGNGDGTFQPAQSYVVGQAPRELVVGDFTGAGRDDLAVTNGYAGETTVSILLSNPDGTFAGAVDYYVGYDPDGLAAADVNGDGQLDLVAGVSGAVRILPGNGDGTFQAGSSYSTGSRFSPVAVAVGDLNQDGLPDLVVPDTVEDAFVVLLNLGGAPAGTPRRHSPKHPAPHQRALTGDFLRAWPPARSGKDSAAWDASIPPASPALRPSEDGWAVHPAGGEVRDSHRALRPATTFARGEGRSEADEVLSRVLDEVPAGPTVR